MGDPFPAPFKPMLASEVRPAFRRRGWIYEEKYDGYRTIVYKEGDRVRLPSRNLQEHGRQFAGVAAAVAELEAETP